MTILVFSYGPAITDSDNTTELKNQKFVKQGSNYPSKGFNKFSLSAKELTSDTDLLDLFDSSTEKSGVYYDFSGYYIKFKSLQDGTCSKYYELTKIYKKLFLNKLESGTNISADEGFVRTTVGSLTTSTTVNVASSAGITVGMAVVTGDPETGNTAYGLKVTVKSITNGTSVVLSEKLPRLQEGQDIFFKDLYEAYIFETKEIFGSDVNFVGESPVSAIRRLTDNNAFTESSTVITNPQDLKLICEFYKQTQDDFGDEFKGKFFLKIKRDDILNANISRTSSQTNTWRSRASSPTTWAHSFLNDNASGNHANVISNTDETDPDHHGAGVVLEDLLGITFPQTAQESNDKFNTHGLTFMVHGNLKVSNFATHGVRIKGTTEGFKQGDLNKHNKTNYWITGYMDRTQME